MMMKHYTKKQHPITIYFSYDFISVSLIYTSSLVTGTSSFLVLVIHLFSIFARSVRVSLIQKTVPKTGIMLAICTDISSLADDYLGLLSSLSFVFVLLLFFFVSEIFVSVGFLVKSATDDIL
jgi:hypothetical protein